MSLVLIDGWWGSGKSVMRGLLDGHPEVFVSPIQDSMPGAFAQDQSSEEWMRQKDIEALRKLMAYYGCYFRIERFSWQGSIHNDASKRNRVNADFNVDFAELDRRLVLKLASLSNWTPEIICERLYETFNEVWHDYPVTPDCARYHVSMDNNIPDTPNYLIEHFERAKLIYIKRAPHGVLATRSNRLPVAGDYRSSYWESLTVDRLIQKGEAHRIKAQMHKVELLEALYPDRVKSVVFEDLVTKTDAVMSEIADFLGISDLAILRNFTFCGVEQVSANGESFVGKVNDDARALLSKRQYDVVDSISKYDSLLMQFVRHPFVLGPYLLRSVKRDVFNRLVK